MKRAAAPIGVAAALLLWPAIRNGYPLVFSDTGTYLSQAIQHYLGWDRPVFYSLFLLPLHMQRTTWPVVVAQALIATHVVRLVQRTLRPEASPWWLVPLTAVLTLGTSLPWVAAELMPDLFTPLMALALGLLVLVPERLGRWERLWLTGLAGFAIAAHLSNPPLAVGLLAVLVPARRWLGATCPLGRAGWIGLAAPPFCAVLAMTAVNLVGHGRASPAPYGNVFLLARVLYDGPGMYVLRHDCPHPGWRLCAGLGRFPSTSDGFLWQHDSPLIVAGGAKRVSAEADGIIAAAIRAEPGRELRALLHNGLRQLVSFRIGDGLHAWPATVTPWVQRDFPLAEQRAYADALQTRGGRVVPVWVPGLDQAVSLIGLLSCVLLLPGILRRREVAAGFIVIALLTLLLNALITGALSGPHARYQSRVMWLPTLMALLTVWPARPWRSRLRGSKGSVLGKGRGGQRPPLCLAPSAVMWSGVEALASSAFSFVSAFIVARLLGPAELGVAAAAVSVHVLLWVAVNALFADAIVQRASLEETAAASAFWASTAVGVTACFAEMAIGWPLSVCLGDGRLAGMSAMLAAALPLVGAGGAVQGKLTRERRYRLLACRALIGQGLGTAVGIGAALAGAGAWALAAQQAMVSTAGAATLLVGSGWRPKWRCQWDEVRALLRVGGKLTASTIMLHGRYRVFALLIGGTAGASALGEVHMAFRMVETVREILATASWRLMLPVLSERQSDPRMLRAEMNRLLAASGAVLFPICGALALTVRPATLWLLGPAWAPAGTAALTLVGLAAWSFLWFPAGVAAVARGVPGIALRANVASSMALVLGVLVLRPAGPFAAVMVWLAAQALVAPYVLGRTARLVGAPVGRLMRAGLPPLALAMLASAAAWGISHMVAADGPPCIVIVVRLVSEGMLYLAMIMALAAHRRQGARRVERLTA